MTKLARLQFSVPSATRIKELNITPTARATFDDSPHGDEAKGISSQTIRGYKDLNPDAQTII